MTVVRELVARLGFQVDQSGFKKAEQGLERVRQAIKRTGDEGERSEARSRRSAALARDRDARGRFMGAAAAAGAAGMGGRDGTGTYRDARGRLRGPGGRFMGAGAKAGAAAGVAAAAGGDGGMMKTLGKVAATAGLTHAIESMVELASSAEETKNVLGAVFGADGQAQVSDWADRMSTDMGRSKYALQKMVGELGAVATPMLGNADRAREMSESYAALAVDMASFYNSSDEDALHALRSAMTGEVESIKKYGVVMNDATLTEYAHTQGIKKKISAMTNAEKTELRYGYIMKVTKAAQGDAARTGEGFSNSIKRVKAMMVDFGTDMGMAVLPKIEKLLVFIRGGIEGFKEFTEGTALLQTAMWTLGGIAAALALELVAPFILPAIAIAALVLVIEDLYQLFSGGESAIGDFIDSMFGIGTTEEVVNSLADAWDYLVDTFTELQETLPDIVGLFDMLLGIGEDWGLAISRWQQKLMSFIKTIVELPNILGKKLAGMLGFKVEQDDAEGRAKGRGLDSEVMSSGFIGDEEQDANQRDRGERIRQETAQRDEVRKQRRAEVERQKMAKKIGKEVQKAEDKLTAGGLSKEEQRNLEDTVAGMKRERAMLLGEDPDEAVSSVNDQVDAEGNASVDPDALANRPRFGRARLMSREERRRRRQPVVDAPVAPPTAAPAATVAAPLSSVDPALFPPATVAASSSELASAVMSSEQPPDVNVSTVNNWNITGANPAEIGRIVEQKLDAQNRKTAAAVSRPSGA